MGKNFAKLLKQHRKSVRFFLRRKNDRLLELLSLSALGLSIGMLVLVLCSIVTNGYKALTVTKVLLSFDDSFVHMKVEDSRIREDCIYHIRNALERTLSDVVDFTDPEVSRVAHSIISETAHHDLAHLLKQRTMPSKTNLWLNTSTEFINSTPGANVIYDSILQHLESKNLIKKFFNRAIFANSHSKVPESAGILGAVVGSLLTIMVCLSIAIPIGVMAGVCLQELLAQSRVAAIIEISINNLSSVPSILFGVLGLIVYLNIFGMPRSSALVGGMTLSMMILPNLINTTRQALTTVPDSVKHAAFSLGASEMQVIVHHSLPIAFPYIVQGIMISVARMIGESSPLIMVGMVAFVVDIPKTFLEPASVLPVQIYIWANNSSAEFTKISAIAIMALLLILLILNMIAAVIKKRSDNFSF